MAPAIPRVEWYIDKVTKQTYRFVWRCGQTVLLESDNSEEVLTTLEILKTCYEPLVEQTLADASPPNVRMS